MKLYVPVPDSNSIGLRKTLNTWKKNCASRQTSVCSLLLLSSIGTSAKTSNGRYTLGNATHTSLLTRWWPSIFTGVQHCVLHSTSRLVICLKGYCFRMYRKWNWFKHCPGYIV